ncbi:MAG: A/G-specific adenine glycosylase [Gammaproteobacteria bacterium]
MQYSDSFMIKPAVFQRRVFNWFDKHGRKNLPWQQQINAYRVWVSEIMLQQTQVNTVIPYFLRFIEQFPNVFALAQADINEVLELWTGLGYYARARNLHRCAQIICANYAGKFPRELDTLISLPGIGRSTAGAILAIAEGQATPILDGNVKRVLTRLHAVEGWPGDNKVQQELWRYAEYYMPETRTADYTQAMMDLGATICTRTKPNCERCPVQIYCQAYQTNQVINFPQSKPKKELPERSCQLLIITNQQRNILLEQRPPSGIWGGLWCFPQCDCAIEPVAWLKHYYGIHTQIVEKLPAFRHTFSHFHLDIYPVLMRHISCAQVKQAMETQPTIWYNVQRPQTVGLAAPIKRLLHHIKVNAEEPV